MGWIIFGLVSFILQIYVLKHTYTLKIKGDFYFDWEKAEKIGIPLWTVLIMLITSFIPIVNIVEVLVFWIVWLKYYSSPAGYYPSLWFTYWKFKDKFFSRKI